MFSKQIYTARGEGTLVSPLFKKAHSIVWTCPPLIIKILYSETLRHTILTDHL